MDIINQQTMNDTVMRNPRKALPRFTALGIILFLSITAAASAQNDEQLAEKALAATVYLEMADKADNPPRIRVAVSSSDKTRLQLIFILLKAQQKAQRTVGW